tara:strand:- start:66 stop:329 length:264 start_codon:yes stop_codon:yes gene_type:complete
LKVGGDDRPPRNSTNGVNMKKYIVRFHLNRDKWSEIVDSVDKESARDTARQWLLNRIDNDPNSLITMCDIHEIQTYGDLGNLGDEKA